MQNPSPLIGQAVGDSLGMPFETLPPDNPTLLAWDGVTYKKSDYHRLRPGQWTDDTMMAKCLAEVLVEGFFPSRVADAYLTWFNSGDLRGMGKATKAALWRLDQGETWEFSGTEGAEGNGSAMRAAPIGAYLVKSPELIADFARVDARITHRSLEAEMGSVAVATTVALLLQGTPREHLVKTLLPALEDCLVRRGLEKIDTFVRQGMALPDILRHVGTGAHVTQTVPAALSVLLLTDSFEEAVVSAIRAGGDTDTTAAIVGAFAGTHYGLDAIPEAWRSGLEQFESLRALEVTLLQGPRLD